MSGRGKVASVGKCAPSKLPLREGSGTGEGRWRFWRLSAEEEASRQQSFSWEAAALGMAATAGGGAVIGTCWRKRMKREQAGLGHYGWVDRMLSGLAKPFGPDSEWWLQVSLNMFSQDGGGFPCTRRQLMGQLGLMDWSIDGPTQDRKRRNQPAGLGREKWFWGQKEREGKWGYEIWFFEFGFRLRDLNIFKLNLNWTQNRINPNQPFGNFSNLEIWNLI
jgi:hypothetical protein